MALFTSKKVAVSSEEKKLPYYKYFLQELAPIPQDEMAILPHNLNSVKNY